MRKILVYTGITVVLLIVVGILFFRHELFTANNPFNSIESQGLNRIPEEKQGAIRDDIHASVEDIFTRAKEGKVPEFSFVAGESKIEEVISDLGEPTNSTTAGDGIYIDYSNEKLTLGYTENIVFDVRSFVDDLQNINLVDIINTIGEPDEERYYKDEQVDQIILVYNKAEVYQLKWVLPRPTDDIPNPTVHHISVYTDPSAVEKETPSLIESMSLDEKIGQMIIAGMDGTTTGPEAINLIEDYKIGGVIFFSDNLVNYSQALDLVNGIKRINSSNKVPLFLSVDQEGGFVRRLPGLHELPTNYEIGVRNEPELSYQVGQILGQELKAFGMNLNYAPVVDVNSNPDNPVIGDRSFGDDPLLVSELGIQTMKGMEAENIIPVIKHFPGHGDTSVDSHLELPRIDKSIEELHELELIPFIHAIQEGADVVMVAHILFPQLDPGYPSSMSKPIITDLLREELGFDGVVVTDDMMMDAIESHYEIGDAAVQSIKAGSDIILVSEHYEDIVETFESLKNAVETGEISEERINESVNRILELKHKYGLSDNEAEYQDIQRINDLIDDVLN